MHCGLTSKVCSSLSVSSLIFGNGVLWSKKIILWLCLIPLQVHPPFEVWEDPSAASRHLLVSSPVICHVLGRIYTCTLFTQPPPSPMQRPFQTTTLFDRSLSTQTTCRLEVLMIIARDSMYCMTNFGAVSMCLWAFGSLKKVLVFSICILGPCLEIWYVWVFM